MYVNHQSQQPFTRTQLRRIPIHFYRYSLGFSLVYNTGLAPGYRPMVLTSVASSCKLCGQSASDRQYFLLQCNTKSTFSTPMD